jgi:hypothetical protein
MLGRRPCVSGYAHCKGRKTRPITDNISMRAFPEETDKSVFLTRLAHHWCEISIYFPFGAAYHYAYVVGLNFGGSELATGWW